MGFVRNTLCAIILAAGLASCHHRVDNKIFSGELDGNKFVVYNVKKDDRAFCVHSNARKVVIYDKSGSISKVLFDDDSRGLNHFSDYVETHHSDGKTTKFTGTQYFDKEGNAYSYYKPDPLCQNFREKAREEFKSANELYQRVLKAFAEDKTN